MADVALEVLAFADSRAPLKTLAAALEKRMVAQAETLPAAEWAQGVRGFGLLRLATIIGEAGDLSDYPNPGKLWKRLGLAPYEGKAYSSWRTDGGLTSDEWVTAGYSPRRRSVVFIVGDCIVKSNGDGPYRTLYLERKAYELAQHPEPVAGKKRKMYTPLHLHRRAQRYMVKRLVRDLWRAWSGGRERPGTQDESAPVPASPDDGAN